jgi:hypothetical protein
MDKHADKILTDLKRESNSRLQNPSLLLEDLRVLGIFGELSDDGRYFTMPFEDVHCLVTTMRMAELILNDRVQRTRKAELERIKSQLDAYSSSS